MTSIHFVRRIAVAGVLACLIALVQPPLAEAQEVEVVRQSIKIPVPGDDTVRADLYMRADLKDPAPGVLVFPTYYAFLFNGSEDFDRDFAKRLAQLGYVAMVPVVTNLGPRVYRTDYGPVLLAVSQWLRDRPEVMDDRIAAVGFSAGCHLGAYLSTLDPTMRAFVGYYGPYDLNDVPFTTHSSDYANTMVAHADKVNGATLLLIGEKDDETPLRQTVTYHDRLKAAGKTVEMVVYPGVYHRFDRGPTAQARGNQVSTGHVHQLNEAARDDAWQRTIALLDKALRQ